MMRQISKQILTLSKVLPRSGLIFSARGKKDSLSGLFNAGKIALFAAFIVLLSPFGVTYANSTRLVSDVVVDPLSGVALNGFDPISYFTDAEPAQGSADFELFWKGVAWYFTSEGNMEIFSKAPEVYAPVYGGHGAMSLARGFLSDGNPLIYKVLDKRLYLFYSFPNREAFELSDKTARLDAIENWQQLRGGQD